MIDVLDLKDHVRIDADQTADDDYLEALELAAVAAIERGTGRYFGPAVAVTEYVLGNGTPRLWLEEEPVAGETITIVERQYAGTTGTTLTAGASDGYLVRAGGLVVRKSGNVWCRGWEYDVAYTRGYAAGQEPEDIKQLVRFVVGYWFENRLPLGDVGVNAISNVLPKHMQAVWNAWRRPLVAR